MSSSLGVKEQFNDCAHPILHLHSVSKICLYYKSSLLDSLLDFFFCGLGFLVTFSSFVSFTYAARNQLAQLKKPTGSAKLTVDDNDVGQRSPDLHPDISSYKSLG